MESLPNRQIWGSSGLYQLMDFCYEKYLIDYQLLLIRRTYDDCLIDCYGFI